MIRDSRGLSLVEVTIAVVLASIVMVGLVGFYVSSQATWIDSSTKAVTQREATLAIEEISRKIRVAGSAVAVATPDANRMHLYLFDRWGNATWHFWWEPADSLIHYGPGNSGDAGRLINSKVTKFQVSVSGGSLVEVLALNLLSPTGEAIEISSAAALYNRP